MSQKPNRVKGFVTISVIGAGNERFVNICKNNGIKMYDLKQKSDSISLIMSVSDFFKIRKIRSICNVSIRLHKKSGLNFYIKKRQKRYFAVIGILAFIAILAVMQNFLWKISVSGCSFYSEDEITKFVAENGITIGSRVKNVSCYDIETAIREHFDRISWVSVYLSGASLKISVKEGNYSDLLGDKSDARDIVAACDGTISSIITRTGTPIVKAGDEVKAGDVLVMSKVVSANEYGDVINTRYVNADADILIESTLLYKDYCPTQYEEKVYTGRTHEQMCLKVGNRIINYNPEYDRFKLYDVFVIQDYVKNNNMLSLPAIYSKICFKEYTLLPQNRTDEEKTAYLEENFAKYIKNLEENSIQIISESVKIEEYDEGSCMSGTITIISPAIEYAEPYNNE